MSKDKFLLHHLFNKPLTYSEFKAANKQYQEITDANQYKMVATSNIYELIQNVKRAPEQIGAYQEISVFESLNRIGSDLVLLSGAAQLFEGKVSGITPEKIHLRMGNTRGFDFEVALKNGKIIYGEAFNAAESFCKEKMRQAINKLIKDNDDKAANTAIVLVNRDVQHVIDKYENQLEKERLGKFKVVKVFCDVNGEYD